MTADVQRWEWGGAQRHQKPWQPYLFLPLRTQGPTTFDLPFLLFASTPLHPSTPPPHPSLALEAAQLSTVL